MPIGSRGAVANCVGEPGGGAVAFCAVVILTMLAAEGFDPRLMWDAAEEATAAQPDRSAALGAS